MLQCALPGRRSLSHHHDAGDARCADETQQRKQRALGQQGRHALGAQAAEESAERRRPCHPRQQRFRRVRVEPFIEQRPEGGDRNPAQHAGVEVEEHRHQPGLWAEQQPLEEEQRGVCRKEQWNRACRPQPGQQSSGERRDDHREQGRTSNQIRKTLNAVVRQEQPIADGVSAHLLHDERRRRH
jgi:hypothetical protein